MQCEVGIEVRIDEGLPAVLADRVQIEQVLVNLLRNAMDAMDAGKTERRSIVVVARRKSSRAVEISVADSGPGVAAAPKPVVSAFAPVDRLRFGHHPASTVSMISLADGEPFFRCRRRRFVDDSLLEQRGFELPVPP
jgi:hypothetical protein